MFLHLLATFSLRSLVRTHPALVTQMLHRNMKQKNVGSAESFNPDSPPNAKFYVEHRSLISHHIANATWAWTVASISDLLSADPPLVEEARARALLAVAAAELLEQKKHREAFNLALRRSL